MNHKRIKTPFVICALFVVLTYWASFAYGSDISVDVMAISENRQLVKHAGKWQAPSTQIEKEVPGIFKLLTLGLVADTKSSQILNLTLRARHAHDWKNICRYGGLKLDHIIDNNGNRLPLAGLPHNGELVRFDEKKLNKHHGLRYLDIPLYFHSSDRSAVRLSEVEAEIQFEQCTREKIIVPLSSRQKTLQRPALNKNNLIVKYRLPGKGPFIFPDMPKVQVVVEGDVTRFGGIRLLESDGNALYVRDDSGLQIDTSGNRAVQTKTLWRALPSGVTMELELETTHKLQKVELSFQNIPLP